MPNSRRYELLKKSLVEARQQKGLTQSEVATRLRKPQSYVSKYESGERRLDVIEFLDVCEALSVSALNVLDTVRLKDEEEVNS
ncbi:MAG: helix-turn-helix transcriptional regulator [Chloroflexi bacterium]|nr:helix-turn-helix transcriptional regulator [Chloroflexota bacterium]